MIIGIFGILKAGCAYLPIDTGYPRERVDFMLKDSNTAIVLNFEHLNFECVSDLNPAQFRDSNLSPANLAYIIYTSGSTGIPKGVMVEHRSLVNLCCWHNRYFEVTANDRATQYAGICFDASVWEIFPYLIKGALLHIIEDKIKPDIEGIYDYFNRHCITIGFLPTQFCQQFMEIGEDISSLRVLLTGGDKLNRFIKRHYTLYNNYGPTENTVVTTSIPVKNQGENIPIGSPIHNNQVFILDKNCLHLQPVGIPGELCIGGESLSRGYLNNPELTAERFVPSPFTLHPSPIYKTGDLARWLPDGNIEFLGRIDSQVKIRGFRIELGEIQNRLTKYKDIKDTVVTCRDDERGDKYLCAYMVTENEVSITGLREYLSARLPAYMIPAYFIRLENIPLTLHGKIDGKSLPDPVLMAPANDTGYTAPKNEKERKLLETWENVLGRRKIGLNANFFHVGGDSIKAIQIVSKMKKAGYKLEMRDLFQHPVLSDLAPILKKIERVPDQSTVTGKIPLTPIQEKFFAGSPAEPHHYNQAVMLYSEEELGEEAVEAVFKKIQDHHDALRMTYKRDPENGEIVQVNHGLDYPLALQVYDFRDRKNSLEMLKTVGNDIQASIHLEKGPLMKLGLFHLDDGDRLLIVIHHLVIDGVSWRILFEDIGALYRQYNENKPMVLPLKTDPFKTWSEQLSLYAGSETFSKEKNYWKQLESLVITPIEKDFQEENNRVKDTERLAFELSEEETDLLLTRANEAFGTGINDILLSALGLGLNKTLGRNRLLIALESHGREDLFKDVDINRTIGWFTSIYPFLLDVSYENDLKRQVKEIKESLRKVPGNGIGYGIYHGTKLNPQISFNYLGQFDADIGKMSFKIAKEAAGDTRSLQGQREYELDVTGMITDNRLVMTIIYNKKQYASKTIDSLLANYRSELSRLIAFCSSRAKRELTPSDFTYKGLSIETADYLNHRYHYRVEDIYLLTPMQEGMLFHLLYDDSSPAYFEQVSYRLHGELNVSLVEKSLNDLFKRHDILRTAFVHEGLERPVQVVLKDRKIDFYHEDIRPIGGPGGRETFLREFKERDKQRSFDLCHDVLMRVSIFQRDEAEYEFTWSFLHILMDGWCIGILNMEFLEIYRDYLQNRPVELPPVKPYRTYIQWLEKQDKEISKNYWESYLAFYEKPAVVPKINLRENKDAGYKNERVRFLLDREKSSRLNEIAARNRVTLNIIFQAVWGIILGRYNGKEDVVFGTVVSGRPPGIEGVESMVGLFINALPVRIRFEGKTTFEDLLQRVQEEALSSESHHYYPLADIQAGNILKQDLIDHIYVFENFPLAEQVEGYGNKDNGALNLRLANVEVFEQTNYDFNIIAAPGDRLTIGFNYNGNIYERDFVERIAGHFNRVITGVISNDDVEINRLSLLSEEEKSRVLYDFNNTRVEYPGDKTIHRLFVEQVKRTPDHIALVGAHQLHRGKNVSLTYRELNEKSDGPAYLLREKGVPGDTIVAIMVERSVEMIIDLLGILKAGGAYLPIDPGYPKERIDYMLKDSGAEILLPTGVTGRTFPSPFILHPSPCTSLAYIIYTSGSTGRPKGVMVGHRSLVNLCCWHNRNFEVTANDRATQYANICFDASVWEIFPYLIKGALLHIIEDKIKPGIEEIYDYFNRHCITIGFLPTQFCQQFMEMEEDISSLRVLLTGGDKLNRFIKRHYNLYNNYGPTENTVVTTSIPVEDQGENIPIGSPIHNNRVFILDKKSLQLQPVGIPGELCIGGESLSRGYLNQPELTAEKFISEKFLEVQEPFFKKVFGRRGQRLYKTGDLARWLPGGNIQFLGRIDSQVKIRGFRIELGEIENRLLKYKEVKDAVVVTKESNNGDRYLCAYLVSHSSYSPGAVREYLSRTLPDYMIPSYFIALDRIPLTPSGKADRKVLPEPAIKAAPGGITPRNEREEKLAGIWTELLGIEKETIGIDANFFDLGGHSLTVTRLTAKIHKQFKVKIPLAEVFKKPTIRELSQRINALREDKFASIQPIEEKEYHELSSVQERLYALQQIEPGNITYNVPLVLTLEGEMNRERLEQTFIKLISRHESLRTSFKIINLEPVQRVYKQVNFEIGNYDFAVGDNEAIQRLIRPFDLARAPLMRVALLDVNEEGSNPLLFIDMHHIITDGTSQAILAKDFVLLYNGSELPPPGLRYKDYSGWQNTGEVKELIKRQEKFWLKEFEGEIPLLNLPCDFPRPVEQRFEGSVFNFKISGEEVEALNKMARSEEASLFIVLLAVYNIFLARISNRQDIIVGTPIAARTHADLEHIIGMFVNTLALRSYPHPGKTFSRFLRESREKTFAAFENQDYPFENLVENLIMEKDMSRNPVFDVMFALQNILDVSPAAAAQQREGVKIKPYDLENRISKFDLTLTAVEGGEELALSFEYSSSLFRESTIIRLANYFKALVSSVITAPGIRISEIEIIPGEEKKQILFDFNNTAARYPEESTIHQLFAGEAERVPDNVALKGESDISITYKELHDKSDGLAYMLREKGVGPNTIVGIMTERSVQMIIGLLGILKAGGAYLPIDPGYPEERIEYMLADSGAKTLLTNDKLPNGSSPFTLHPSSSTSLAYVIYTSGSTGRPKGVIVEHRNVVNYIYSFLKICNITSTDIMLQQASFTFDTFTEEVFPVLLMGGKIAIPARDVILDINLLLEFTARVSITIIDCSPLLLNELNKVFVQTDRLNSVHTYLSGGDALKKEYIDNLLKRAVILNGYGPTEITVCTAFYRCRGNEPPNIPIGKPISNYKVYILDKDNLLQPIGVVGEICVSGDGVTRGYLNQPELTREKFQVTNSKSSPVAKKIYKTGDLGRWLPDGNIEFLGRIDFQMKIRGFRIELGEIETRLLNHKEIKKAIVRSKQDETGNQYICAYIVSDNTIPISQLRTYLSVYLPDYMIPAYFVELEELPLTSNGKIDHKALPDPQAADLAGNTEYCPPANALEKKLVETWEKVLGRKKIGINDNFFMMGGDSIKSIQVAARMNNAGYRLEVKNILQYPSIAELASKVVKLEQLADQAPVTGIIPLTPIQEDFFHSQVKQPSHYNQAVMFFSGGGFEEDVLKKVILKLQEHHDALRMSYKKENGKIIQTCHDLDYPVSLEVYDFRGRGGQESAVKMLEAGANRIQAGIDLEKGPLMKWGLFHLGDGDRLLIVIHHLVTDAVSWRILFEDIETLYQQYKKGEDAALPPKTHSFKHWSQSLSEYADSQLFLQEKAFWKEMENHAVEPIKKDLPGDNCIKNIENVSFSLGEEETGALLTGVNQAFGTEINDILLTALGMGIKKTFGSEKILIALESHGREEIIPQVDITRTLGWFTSVYPVLLDFSHQSHGQNLARQIKEIKESLHRVPNKGIGYGILEFLTHEQNKREMDFNLKPQVSFNYLGQFDTDVSRMSFGIAREPLGNLKSPDSTRDIDLDVTGIISNNRLIMTISYSIKRFRTETIEILMHHYKTSLDTVISYCLVREEQELTPSDLTYKSLTIDDIDTIEALINN